MRDLWRHQPGQYFCVSTKAPWRDHFFARDELHEVDEFVSLQRGRDVYFCPHGFSRRKRLKQFAVLPTLLWADLDEVDPHKLRLRPTIAIQSSPGRFVGIWECDGVVSEQLNKALTYHVGADRGGWDLTQVLRMPGSRNHKYTPAPRVTVLWDDGPDYRVRDIERAVVFVKQPQRSVHRSGPPVAIPDWRDVVAKYPGAGVRKFMGGCDKGKRSDVIYRIISNLAEHGASAEEIYAVVAESGAAKAKADEYGGHTTWLWRDVERILAKRKLQ